MKRPPLPVVIGGLLVLQLAFVVAYVVSEHTIYFWDHSIYILMAQQLRMAASAGMGWFQFTQSLADDYNLIFALPSLVTFWLFDSSRLTFIVTNFLVFFLAYELGVAFVLRQIWGWKKAEALVAALALSALVPPMWLPLLEGYPDTGAAACLTFAFGLLLGGDRGFRKALLVGAICGLAVLLRRHFAYAAIALLATAGLFDFIKAAMTIRAARLKNVSRVILFYGPLGLTAAGIVYLVAPTFFMRAVTTDYGTLYHSYEKPAIDVLAFIASSFGLLLLSAAIVGFGVSFKRNPFLKQPLLLVVLTTLAWLGLWSFGPAETGHHYLLHIMPVFVVVGLAGFWPRELRPTLPIALVLLALLGNSAETLWFAAEGAKPNDHGAPGLLSAPRPPVVRSDYDELVRLANTLAETTTPDDRIFVLGSSFVFNQDIVRAVYTDVLNRPDIAFRLLTAPEIDGKQFAPLNEMATATVYVVPDPPQYHLAPEGQKVVTAAAKQFPPPPDRASLFKSDDAVFNLMDNVTVRIWRRQPWTPRALRAALVSTAAIAPSPPQNWVITTTPLSYGFGYDELGRVMFQAAFSQDRPELELFYNGEMASGDYRLHLSFRAQDSCANTQFEILAQKPAETKTQSLGLVSPPSAASEIFRSFTLTPSTSGYYLRLKLKAATVQPCLVMLQRLGIESVRR